MVRRCQRHPGRRYRAASRCRCQSAARTVNHGRHCLVHRGEAIMPTTLRADPVATTVQFCCPPPSRPHVRPRSGQRVVAWRLVSAVAARVTSEPGRNPLLMGMYVRPSRTSAPRSSKPKVSPERSTRCSNCLLELAEDMADIRAAAQAHAEMEATGEAPIPCSRRQLTRSTPHPARTATSSSEPQHEDHVDLALVLQDQIDHQTSPIGSKHPPSTVASGLPLCCGSPLHGASSSTPSTSV